MVAGSFNTWAFGTSCSLSFQITMVYLQHTNFEIRNWIMEKKKKNKWHYKLQNKVRNMKKLHFGWIRVFFFPFLLLRRCWISCTEHRDAFSLGARSVERLSVVDRASSTLLSQHDKASSRAHTDGWKPLKWKFFAFYYGLKPLGRGEIISSTFAKGNLPYALSFKPFWELWIKKM